MALRILVTYPSYSPGSIHPSRRVPLTLHRQHLARRISPRIHLPLPQPGDGGIAPRRPLNTFTLGFYARIWSMTTARRKGAAVRPTVSLCGRQRGRQDSRWRRLQSLIKRRGEKDDNDDEGSGGLAGADRVQRVDTDGESSRGKRAG